MDETALPSIAPSEPVEETKVSIAPVDTPSPVDPTRAAQSVVKAKYGLPSLPSTHEAMFQSVLSGQEDYVRKEAASLADFQTSMKKQQFISDLSLSGKRTFTPLEAKTVRQFMDTKATDPNSVFEEFYAKTYMENLRTAAESDPDSYLNEMRTQNPRAFEKGLEVGTDLKAKKEWIGTLAQKLDDEKGGMVSHVYNWLKYITPFYNEYNLRGVTGDYKSLLGTNLDRVATDLWHLPFDQFKAKVQNIVSTLNTGIAGGNPLLSATFMQHMTDPDVQATIVDNVFSAIDFSAFATKPAALFARARMGKAAAAASDEVIKKALAGTVNAPEPIKPFNPGDFSSSLAARSLADRLRPQTAGEHLTMEPFAPPLGERSVIWRNKDTDLPVTKIDEPPQKGPDGRMYQKVNFEGKDSFVPADELVYSHAGKKPSTGIFVPSTTKPQATTSFMEALAGKAEEGAKNEWLYRSQRLVQDMKQGSELIAGNPTSVKSFMEDTLKKIEVAANEAAGNIRNAASLEATRQIVEKLTPGAVRTTSSVDGLQSAFTEALVAVRQNTRGASAELVNQLFEGLESTRSRLATALQNTLKIERIPGILAIQKNVDKVIADSRKDYPGFANMFLDSKIRYDKLENVHYLDHYIGKGADKLFSSERDAQAFIGKHLNLPKDVAVEPQGAGFKIKITTPLRETGMVTREGLLELEGARTPDSWLNAYGGYLGSLRTAEETLSAEQQMNRKVAAYGPSNLLNLAREEAKEIKELRGWTLPGTARRAKWNEWQRVMDEIRKVKDPVTGRYEGGFKTIGDLQDFYQNVLHRLPDEQEIKAAFSYKKQQLILKELKELRVRTEILREGGETHDVFVRNAEPEAAQAAKNVKSQYNKITVDGVSLREIPTDGETVLILGEKEGQYRVVNTSQIRSKGDLKAAEEVKTGQRTLIRLSNPEERPFGFLLKDKDIRPMYIVDNGQSRIQTRPLEWRDRLSHNMPDYDYDHYVAQPIVRNDGVSKLSHYEGDRHIMAHNIRAVADDVAEKLNDIRKLLKDEKVDEARAFHSTSGLPQSFSEIQGWFKPSEGAPARLSLNEDIRRIAYNHSVVDLDKELERKYGSGFRDNTKDTFKRFLADNRDPDHIWTADNSGTKANPDYKVTPVKYLDPITSMNRAMNRAINDSYLNDYKLFSVEHWIQEAKEYLAIDDKRLASAPTYFFYNPTWKKEAPVDKVNNLMTAQLQIKQFLGIQDKTSTYLHAAAQKLSDVTYEKFGNKFALVPSWALPKLREPTAFVRSLTFDATLGLFALPQLWVQLQTFTNIAGIAGFSMAAPGARAMLLHQWSRLSHDPAILDHLDKLAQGQIIPGTERFRPGWFREAHTMLINNGFELVGKEHARLDNPFGHNIIGHAGSDFLNWGRTAFTEGEKATRIGAWYTSYLEFRAKNPTGAITNAQEREILNRADLLTSNMSRASASMLNSGVMSIPTQFLTYTLRTAELFMGKRLTGIEKARLFGFNAAVYGLPTAFGLSGLPFGQTIRQWAQEDGYVVGDNYINSLVTEGGLSTLLHHLSGYHYNVGERFGPQGFEDALRSDKTWWELVGGAAGSKMSNAIASMDGFTNAMLSAFRDDNKAFKLTLDDYAAPFKEISAVNSATKLWAGINTLKQVTKKGEPISDVTAANAIFMFFSGLSTQEQADMFTKNLTRKEEKKAQDEGLSKFVLEFRRFIDNHEKNPEQANQHFKNAFALLRIYGYPEEDYPKAVSIATHDYENMINRTNWDYYLKDVPEFRKPKAIEAFQKTQMR